MAILRKDEVQRCREWQRLARKYNEVNENGEHPGVDSSKSATTLRRTSQADT